MKKTKGFTLIEVLVALAIIAIALLAVIKVSAHSVRQTSQLKEKLASHWVAMNVISRAQTNLIVVNDGYSTIDGSEEMLGKVWE